MSSNSATANPPPPPSSTTTSSSALDAEIGQGALRLAEQLRSYVPQNALPDVNSPTSPSIPDLQLAICRKLRELLPSNRELLHTAQTSNWIPMLLSWLNLHDRPAVQVEALLALTNVAELCCALSPPAYSPSALAAAAAQAAVSAVKNGAGVGQVAAGALAATAAGQSWNDAVEAAASKYGVSSASLTSSKYNPYLSAAGAAAAATSTTTPPGSVPFPPLSFSQSLSPEAVAAFDASLTQTILACQDPKSFARGGGGGKETMTTIMSASSSSITSSTALTTPAAAAAAASALSSWSMPPAPLFPTSTPTAAGGINFTSLAPPPGGAHTSVPSNAFLPPPTPVTAPNFPQQLSASSQHMLLRHHDAIPTLISLLSSPRKEVYEQAVWILGSIAAGDAPTSSSSGGSNSSGGGSSSVSSAAAAALSAAAAAATDPHHRDSTSGGGGGTGSSTTTNSNSSSQSSKSVSARDVILAAGVMNQLLRCLEQHPDNLSLQRIGSWTLSNLLDGIFQQQTSTTSSSSQSSSSRNSGGNSKSNASGSSSSSAAAAPSSSSQSLTHPNTDPSASSTSVTASSSSSPSSLSSFSAAEEVDMTVLMPVLRRLLRSADAEVLGYTCWALSHLCDGPSSHIAAIVTSPSPESFENSAMHCGLVPRLVELLTHPSWRVTKPALRTIGNIVYAECSDDSDPSTDYTEVILDCQAVPRLKQLVEHNNREIQKEACWTLSNIAAGTVDQIQSVIESGAIPPLVKLVKDKKTDQEVRSEACWVVLNATSCGSDSQIEVLVDEGCVSVLGVLLSEASMVMMALEGLERVLQVEETRGVLRPTPLVTPELIEQARESHNSTSVIKRADRIWKTHFVQCALCKLSFSKHRGEAHFCEECKCHVCGSCNCMIYHLDYQEELWAATEEKSEAKKNAKKTKNKKKKAKKKAKQQQEEEKQAEETRDVDDTAGGDDPEVPMQSSNPEADSDNKKPPSPSFEYDDEEDTNVVDFVLYLQQTGSIIALAKLMDALEDGDEDELNDYERRMIREQQMMREQAALNPAH